MVGRASYQKLSSHITLICHYTGNNVIYYFFILGPRVMGLVCSESNVEIAISLMKLVPIYSYPVLNLSINNCQNEKCSLKLGSVRSKQLPERAENTMRTHTHGQIHSYCSSLILNSLHNIVTYKLVLN